jgi:hypothetical protein
MNKVIYKYPIPLNDTILLQLPKNAEILFVETQNGDPFIWCLINPELELEPRYFYLYGTGHIIEDEEGYQKIYIGTFKLLNDSLILHLFERVSK